MESKKVKEIKELFKNCDFTLKHCGNCVLWKDEDCIETIKSKVLTLINELERGNEALSFAVKQGFNDCKTKTLKQFAERLKEKAYDSFGDKVIWYNDIDETLEDFMG